MASRFEPGPDDKFALFIDGQRLTFRSVPHPAAPTTAHVITAGRADVHRIREPRNGYEYALKVFMARHRGPHIAEGCVRLDALKRSGGLSVCDRRCLAPGRADDTIAEYPNLQFAVLMPWIRGESWFDVLAKGKEGDMWSETDGMAFALRLAMVLARFEEAGMAHGDISAGNVILNRQSGDLQLVDVEDMFAPGWPRPKTPSPGSPGYRHRTAPADVWSATADRFAGAVLLSEMLAWSDPDVRRLAHGESYFDQTMIDAADDKPFEGLRTAVARCGREPARLLETAWRAPTIDACPPISDWYRALQSASAARYGISTEPAPKVQHTPVQPFWVDSAIPVEPPRVEWEPRPTRAFKPPEWK